jgi:hypothetical protein
VVGMTDEIPRRVRLADSWRSTVREFIRKVG